MLLVRVENIDRAFFCVYGGDDPAEAAQAALAGLIKDHEFFKDNVFVTEFPPSFTPSEDVFGILMLSNEAMSMCDREYAVDAEDTYWITIRPYDFGEVF